MLAVRGVARLALALGLLLSACEPNSAPISSRGDDGLAVDADGVSDEDTSSNTDEDASSNTDEDASSSTDEDTSSNTDEDVVPGAPATPTGADDAGMPMDDDDAGTPADDDDAGMSSTPPPTTAPPSIDSLTTDPCSVAGCPAGLECLDEGYCATPAPDCRVAADCSGTDETCGLTGVCLEPGGCRVDGDCGDAESCNAMLCERGTDCGQTELTIEPVVPNVLVLLDVSGSMGSPINGIPKIDIAKAAITQMTATYNGRIRWGVAFFSGDGSCAPPVNVIAPADNNETAVDLAVQGQIASGSTPINSSIAAVQAATYLKDPNHPNYLLFITDGQEACGGSDDNTRVRIGQMFNNDNIGTFVVGFGGGVDATTLNQFANAGGFPNMTGPNSFYAADNATALEMALGAILGSVIGCDFALTAPPADPDKVFAFFDNILVTRDDPNGWILDLPNSQVTFQGDSCTRLRNNDVTDIDVVFGCPEPIFE